MKRAILLVDHGSRRAEANDVLTAIARLVESHGEPGLVVRHAHMELAAPSVADAFAACVEAGARHVDVMPYFLGPGRHVTEDIPRLVAEAAARHEGVSFRIAEPLGVHPALAHAVLERCRPLA